MPDPKWAAIVNGTRRYKHPTKNGGAHVYTSVTSVAKIADPGNWKIPWAALMTAQKAVESIATLQSMKPEEAVKWLKGAPYVKRDEGGRKGTEAHTAMEAIMAGQPVAADTPWIDAGRRFVADMAPEPEAMEISLYCDALLTAGTADFIGRLKARPDLGRVLLDWKTAKDVHVDMLLQVAAYGMTSEYSLDDAGTEHPFKPPDTMLIVLLGADGNYSSHIVPKDQRLVRAFRACLELVRFTDAGVAATVLEPETPLDEVVLQQWLEANPDKQLELATACQAQGVEIRKQHRTAEDVHAILTIRSFLWDKEQTNA